jgi:hypothetical protein
MMAEEMEARNMRCAVELEKIAEQLMASLEEIFDRATEAAAAAKAIADENGREEVPWRE